MTRYPRDLTGYGNDSPTAHWPGGAKIAVQVVLNYEEGSENNILHGDDASEAFLSEMTGATPWPRQRHWNMESIYEYGSRGGFWRVHSLLRHLPITVYGVATALARAPQQLAAMQQAGWEIASHGLKWVEHKDMSVEEERQQIREAIRLHTEVTGQPPRGWYTGRCSMNTVALAAEEGDFLYIADSYADDLPYWISTGGKDQLIVPYTMDCNDMRFAIQAGFANGDQFESYLKDSFDMLYAEGQTGQAKMMSIGLHCRIIGRPGRAMALKRALDYFKQHDGVWFATRAQIADHWMKHHPPKRHLRPSAMDRQVFVAAFGDVFEHSPWIADKAYDLELGPTHDNAFGVHSTLARVFRSAGEKQRLDVLMAHPDLAGKLAAAGSLTPDSTAEQAGAGLDMLTDAERATFTTLNETYMSKFGFPFIIAVRDNSKASIMAAFQRRIDNDRATEFGEACRQVERIALLRLQQKFAQ
jgi:OHCU decarboxylase